MSAGGVHHHSYQNRNDTTVYNDRGPTIVWAPVTSGVSNWRKVYAGQRVEYTGTLEDLMKSFLDGKDERAKIPSFSILVLPKSHEYFWFNSKNPTPDYLIDGVYFLKLMKSKNQSVQDVYNEYKKFTGFWKFLATNAIFAMNVNTIGPILLEKKNPKMVKLIHELVKISEEKILQSKS